MTRRPRAPIAAPTPTIAAIAQLVEHFIRNEKVVGSSPTRGSLPEFPAELIPSPPGLTNIKITDIPNRRRHPTMEWCSSG